MNAEKVAQKILPRPCPKMHLKTKLFSGFSRTEHILLAIKKFGPMSRNRLWDALSMVNSNSIDHGMRSKTEFHKILRVAVTRKRVKPLKGQTSIFKFHLTLEKENNFDIPESFLRVYDVIYPELKKKIDQEEIEIAKTLN
jgi:hypothetical protein